MGLKGFLLMPVQALERGQQRPRGAAFGAQAVTTKPDEACAWADIGLKAQEGLEDRLGGPNTEARRAPIGIDRHRAWLERGGRLSEPLTDARCAREGLDLPGQSEQVAPVAVGLEQAFELSGIGRLQRGIEAAEPVF